MHFPLRLPNPMPWPRALGRTLCRASAGVVLVCASSFSLGAGLAIGTSGSPSALPLQVAQDQGFFAAEGVVVELKRCSSGPRCMDELFAHGVQLVAVTDLPVVTASFLRTDFAVVATITTSNSNIRLMARRSAGITTPEQLARKRIGVMVGTSAQYYLDVYLHFHGVDPGQAQVVPLAPDAIAAAFASGRIDALAAFSRQTRQVLAGLGGDGILLPNPRIYTDTYNLVADRATLAQRGGDIVRVLRALQRADDFIASSPQQAKRILVQKMQLDRETADEILPTLNFRLSLDQSLVSTLESVARWARRGGHVAAAGGIPDYRSFIETGPLVQAVPGALPK